MSKQRRGGRPPRRLQQTPSLASSSADETIKLWDVRTGECLRTLHAPGPYTPMNITGAIGLTEAQKAALKALGAVEYLPAGSRDSIGCE